MCQCGSSTDPDAVRLSFEAVTLSDGCSNRLVLASLARELAGLSFGSAVENKQK